MTDKQIHLVGIKGTGMAALAEILLSRGARVTGSDVPDRFYTDRILEELGIPVCAGFAAKNVPHGAELVIYSAAYSKEQNEDLKEALRRGLEVMVYPEALGLLSRAQSSSGIAGVHGKTTTTALTGTLIKALELPVTILAGSLVPGFNNRCTLCLGTDHFVAETCEYRRHFLNFHGDNAIITSVEMDHPDYFKDLEDMMEAFVSFGTSLGRGGNLIYNHDDANLCRVIERIQADRPDLNFIPYGTTAPGPYGIKEIRQNSGELLFTLAGFEGPFRLTLPGIHNVFNAAAGIALCCLLIKEENGQKTASDPVLTIKKALETFKGTKRRSEIIGRARGILFMDDYGHHPTAVKTTLEGLKSFYADRRLVVDFMSHTYSRTRTLLNEFAGAFGAADLVVLHKIYSSAREKNTDNISGEDLYRKVREHRESVKYFTEPEEALPYLKEELKEGDLFVTMGAGDNWKVGESLYQQLKGGNEH